MFQLPELGPTPDLTGAIGGVPSCIECNRIEFGSAPARDRRQIWRDLSDSILVQLDRLGRPTLVQVAMYSTPTDAMLTGIIEWFTGLQEPPDDGYLRDSSDRYVVRLKAVPPGRFLIEGDLDDFDYLDVNGVLTNDGSPNDCQIVGIEDHVPFDWLKSVRNTLRSARQQLDPSKCNLICLELADIANFEAPEEFQRIQEAVEDFFHRDTRRVSGVLITTSGIVPHGENAFRSAGRCWLFQHENPYVHLPNSFEPPSFNHPRITVRASVVREEIS